MPKGLYNGQKLTKLVSKKIKDNVNKTIPNVPEIVPLKYNTTIIVAIITLIILSVIPIFFFILTNIILIQMYINYPIN